MPAVVGVGAAGGTHSMLSPTHWIPVPAFHGCAVLHPIHPRSSIPKTVFQNRSLSPLSGLLPSEILLTTGLWEEVFPRDA